MGGILQALDINGTFVAQIVDFALLFLFMRFFVWPPLARAMEQRRQKVRQALAEAEEERRKAEEERLAQVRALEEARAEAQAIVERAQRTAAEEARTLLEEARAQGERLQRQFREEMERERAAAVLALRNEVAELVLEATGKLLRARMDNAEDRRLVADLISAAAGPGAGEQA
jgi:F-type H+-transporting ATPase subunit b